MINNKVFSIVNEIAGMSDSVDDSGILSFSSNEKTDELKKMCASSNIGYDKAGADNEISFEIPEVKIFSSFNIYRRSLSEIIKIGEFKKYDFYCYFSEDRKRLFVLDSHSISSSCFYDGHRIDQSDYEASNVYYWEQLSEYICDHIADEKNTDRSFSIISYKKGRSYFTYSEYDEQFNGKDLQKLYSQLCETIKTIDRYKMLIKNRCVERIEQNKSSDLKTLISELAVICEKVILDFEIFVSNIDFDSYTEKFHEKMNTLILQTRSIVEKILLNIFTLPLTYAGAIFTFDKMDNGSFFIPFFVAIAVYIILSCGFLLYEFFETLLIGRNLKQEIKYYTNGSQILKKNVNQEFNSIKRRLCFIRVLSVALIFVFIILFVILGYFVCPQPIYNFINWFSSVIMLFK